MESPSRSTTALADDVAAELVRSFAAIDWLLQDQYETQVWETPDRVAERLRQTIAARLADMERAFGDDAIHDMWVLLAEAIDNLGRGERLDPWDALAFMAPVGFRSHRVVLDAEPDFPDDVERHRARLLEQGIVVLADRDGQTSVSGAPRERALAAVEELLPGRTVDVAGRTPREIRPARCVSWRRKADDELRVWVRHWTDEHIDQIVAAEDEEKVVVLAFICSPVAGLDGHELCEPGRVDLRAPLGERRVIDGLTGESLPCDR
jgi:hypothetical protein